MKSLGDVCGIVGRWFALALIGLAAGWWSIPAGAQTLRLNQSLCHAVTELQRGDDSLASLRFACSGEPSGYQQGSLWLRASLDHLPMDRDDLVLMVHQSRFDRLAVAFSYADGVVRWQQVRSGDFASHWRAGGQIEFAAPARRVPLASVTMRFDRLASRSLVHARLMERGTGAMQSAALAASIGAALTLLLISGLYNFSLAFAVRRQFLAWHGAWAACMLLWGGIWSQMHLLVVPGMAGTASAQTCTFLSCLAVALATASAVTSLGGPVLPRWMRAGTLALGIVIAVAGIPLALIRSAALMPLADLLGILILLDLLAVAICLGWAWRRGCAEARDFSGAWSLPMITLALITVIDVEDGFWGGGSKLLVLLAATWQTLWLSVAATRRLANLRIERDRARAAEARAHELALRDPLTGLRNRRGFIETVTPLLEHARMDVVPVALLLIDVDRFKSVNDIHGHDAGDKVLCTIARRIERWEGALCTVARLGGEEFALMVAGLESIALTQFAENVRIEIAACDHGEAIGKRSVTASIGVASTLDAGDFQQLYKLADEALYDAKRQGRDRVSLRRLSMASGLPDQPDLFRAQS